ncbi:hypothetical protein ACFL0C_00015 [Patescibacteria group bacterium]
MKSLSNKQLIFGGIAIALFLLVVMALLSGGSDGNSSSGRNVQQPAAQNSQTDKFPVGRHADDATEQAIAGSSGDQAQAAQPNPYPNYGFYSLPDSANVRGNAFINVAAALGTELDSGRGEVPLVEIQGIPFIPIRVNMGDIFGDKASYGYCTITDRWVYVPQEPRAIFAIVSWPVESTTPYLQAQVPAKQEFIGDATTVTMVSQGLLNLQQEVQHNVAMISLDIPRGHLTLVTVCLPAFSPETTLWGITSEFWPSTGQ